MHGSPCQDFSIAGKQAGGDFASGTRSSLLYETVRIVSKIKPKYVIWENVKNLLSAKHRHNFENYLVQMQELGYNNYYQVLNAKDYGIPQNRERVFTISIRQDVDNKTFKFPEKQVLKLRLKDMLEENVDEKYYLSDKMLNYIQATNEKWTGNNDKCLINKSVASALNTLEGARRCDASNYVCDNVGNDYDIRLKQVGQLEIPGWNDTMKRVYSDDGLSPTIPTCQGGNTQPKIVASTQAHAAVNEEGICPTLTTAMGSGGGQVPMVEEPQVINPLKDKTEYSWQFEQQVYDEDGITRAVKAGGGSGNIPKLLIKNANKKGYAEAYDGDSINLAYPNSETRRGRVGNQVAQTLQCNDSIGVVTTKPKLVGGIGEINYGKQYRQGNRIYDSDGVAMALLSKPVGNAGGNSYLYKVEEPKIETIGNYSPSGHDASRVVDENGLAPTVKENHGTVTAVQINQMVRVRKYPVDTDKLKETLIEAKAKTGLTNSRIAFELEQPITTVEHWFRKDDCFSIPDDEIWYQLKNLLEITTNEFDESIMTFEEREGVYEKTNRVYQDEGIAPTLTQQQEKVTNGLRIRKLTPKECWRLMGFHDDEFERAEKVNSNTQLYKQAGNSIVVNVLEEIFKNLLQGDEQG